MSNRLSQERALQYMLAGNAIVVLHSMNTGKQFRYKIIPKPQSTTYWHVYDALITIGGRGTYVGTIGCDKLNAREHMPDPGKPYFFPNKEVPQLCIPSRDAMAYTIKHLRLQKVPEELHILHTGYCSVCSRPLKDAVSLEYGIGPECRKKLGIK